jgi:uncharacterized membrane protein
MDLLKVFLWLILAAVAWVVVSTVLSFIFAAISFLVWLIQTGVTLAIIGGLAYGGYKLYDLLSEDSATPQGQPFGSGTRTDSEYTQSDTSSRKTPQERYANGEIDETQLERELERELDDGGMDNIDRELQRERN